MQSRNLFKEENGSSTYVDVKITGEGDLHVLRNAFGPGNFETEVSAVVSAEYKDLLLLVLLEQIYVRNRNALDEFVAFARSKNVDLCRQPSIALAPAIPNLTGRKMWVQRLFDGREFLVVDGLLFSPLLRRGERRDIVSPILSGQYRNVPVLIFDMLYGRTESSGESYNFYFRSVVAFSLQGRRIPSFSLLPTQSENTFSEMVPGERAITFQEDPKFSNRYIVKGPEREALKQVFGPQLRHAFVQSKDQWIAGVTDDHFVMYKDRQTDDLIREADFETYLTNAYSFYQIMVTVSGTHILDRLRESQV